MSVDEHFKNSDTVRDFESTDRRYLSFPEESDGSDGSFDVLEQHQAKEQTRLLHKFKELRQWQQQQQQQLILQQYQQLKAMKEEQDRVQMYIATQQVTHRNKGSGGRASPVSPPTRPPLVTGNHVQKDKPQVNQSNGAGVSMDSGLASSLQDTLKSQNSLPKPVMYIDPTKSVNPNDEDKYTDSELFSNPGACDDQLDILGADNPNGTPDWMSDNSDHYNPPKLPPPRPIRGGRNGSVNDQLAGLEHLLNTAPIGLLQQVLNLLPVKPKAEAQPDYTDEIELSASPTLPQPGQQPRARKLHFHQSLSATTIQPPTEPLPLQPALYDQQLSQQQRQHYQNKNVNLGHMMADTEHDRRHASQAFPLTDVNMNNRHLFPGDFSHDEDSSDEWEDQMEEQEEEDDCDNQNITVKEIQNTSLDDRPIHGLNGKKSFEQLLEEQLKAEAKELEDEQGMNKPHKKPFLRKGEGISRFNSAPKKPPKKVSRKPDYKTSVTRASGKGSNSVRDKPKHDGLQVTDTADVNKKPPVGYVAKDKPLTSVAKPVERKLKKTTTKFNSGPQEAVPNKPVAKLNLIHNAAQRKIEEQRSQQKESDSYKTDKNSVGCFNSGGHNQMYRSPSQESKSDKSEDRDSTELDSLAEFELLEDAVDNISFRSNSSLVQKIFASDRRGQKDVISRLRTIAENRNAGTNIPSGEVICQSEAHSKENHVFTKSGATALGTAHSLNENYNRNNSSNIHGGEVICQSEAYSKENHVFTKSGATALGTAHGLNENYNRNNSSNIHSAEISSDLSDATLTDSSAEEDNVGRSSYARGGEATVQNGFTANGDSASNSVPALSPNKVMSRKVAPMAAKFAAANDTLAMLKSLSLQSGSLTAVSAAGTSSASMNSESRPGVYFTAASSSVSNQQRLLASDSLENHHKGQQDENYSLAPSRFSGSSNLPADFKVTSAPVVYSSVSESSLMFNQMKWLESKTSNMSSSHVYSGNTSNFNSKSSSIDADSGVRSASASTKLYDSFQQESSSDKDSVSSDDSEDDFNEVDRVTSAAVGENVGVGGEAALNPEQSGFTSASKNVESEIGAASSVRFNDETSWTDDDDDENHNVEEKSCLKVTGLASSVTTVNTSSPPTSKLMSRLFPKLKPKSSAETEKANQVLQQASAQPTEMCSCLQSHSLREKLMKLDVEIEKFRSENAGLDLLRREKEEGLAKLKQEIDNFQRQKEDELRRLEEFKIEEIKKLKRERKLFDNYQKKIRSMPDKRDREEIDNLKTQLQELQDELKHKEGRWNSSTARLKNRIAELELENGELKEEIRILEKKRLEWMTAQSHVKAVVQSNGKVASGESGAGKSGGASKQTLAAQVRSSTPTTEADKVKVPSSLGLKEAISAGPSSSGLRSALLSHTPANSSKNSRLGSSSSNLIHKSHSGPVSQIQNGVGTSVSKSSASKPTAPAVHANLSGEGIQSNSVPTMMENTLPVATQASAMPGSLASSVTSGGKSAALVAMEHAVINKGDISAYAETRHQDGKIEKTFKTGAKEIHFPNGTVKEISADGQTVLCRLANGDIRQIFPDHRVVYIFAEAEIMQTTFPDGLETFQFKNGQIERRYPDGTVEITFPSKDVKFLFPDGGQEVILTDGTVMQYNTKGERIIEYPTGDREVHTAEYQRREFPDGIVKTVFSDGRHETRFPNGRIRLRDKAGIVIMDQIVYR